jgi:hypothetical protein
MQDALGVLGRRVAATVVVDLDSRDGGDRDDQPVAGVDQLGQQRLRDMQSAHHVGLPHPAPVLDVGVGHRLQTAGTAGVVDEHIHPVQPPGEGRDGRAVGDVRHDRGAVDLGGKGLDGLLAPRYTDHVESLRGKCSRGRFADSGAGSGDHRNPARI